MAQSTHHSPLYAPEYTGASVVLHAGCLTLLFLNLHYYTSKQQPLITPREQEKAPPKKEPRVIMKRIPVTPTPKIAEEQEQSSTQPTPPSVDNSKHDYGFGGADAPLTPVAQEQSPAAPAQQEITQQQVAVKTEVKQITEMATQEVRHETPSSSQDQTSKSYETTPGLRQNLRQEKIIKNVQQAERVKRSKMQHSWYSQQKTSQTTETSVHTTNHSTTRTTAATTIREMTLAHVLQRQQPSSTLSQAQQLAENFKRDFQEAAVNDYISAIHHAIAFSLNRMRIMLAPAEIPPQITMYLTITKRGSLTDTRVFIHGYDNPSLANLIKQAIMQAAPFRPFPPSITTPDLNVNISAYPDGSHAAAGQYSSRPTPLLFTLLR